MSKLIVALDGMNPGKALQIARELAHLQANGLWGFKIGHSLTFAGAQWIAQLKKTGKVFVDLKLYDIPNTVEKAVDWLARLHVDLTTVHLSMGRSTLEKISDKGVGFLGVSLLTSANPDEFKDADFVIVDINLDVSINGKFSEVEFSNFKKAIKTIGLNIKK